MPRARAFPIEYMAAFLQHVLPRLVSGASQKRHGASRTRPQSTLDYGHLQTVKYFLVFKNHITSCYTRCKNEVLRKFVQGEFDN